jgi:hypothetical protein
METLKLFLHSVEKDIAYLEGLKADQSILNRLRALLDNVRSQGAYIYSNDKKGIGNLIGAYFTLNLETNAVYNGIVTDRADYLLANIDEPAGPIDAFILRDLFLSYTIFLDAYSELGFYYIMCENFPFRNASYFAIQKSIRAAERRLDKEE